MTDDFQRGSRSPAQGGEAEKEVDDAAEAGGSRPVEASPSAADAKIATLEDELRAKSGEAAANFDRYVRAVADGENLKKRLQREKAEAIRFANEALLRDLVPIIDNLERAIEHAGLGGNGKSVVEGVELTLRMFRDVLERHGVREVTATGGTAFDPSVHEAADARASSEHPPNTVIQQREKGYLYHDRLLRPAKVVVALAPAKDEGNSGE